MNIGIDLSVTRMQRAGVIIIASDDYNRANASLAGQSTPVGNKPYTISQTGGTGSAAINGNQLTLGNTTGGTQTFLTIDAGQADARVVITLASLGATPKFPGLIIRYVDANNFVLVQYNANGLGATNYALFKKVAGAFTQIGTAAIVPAAGDTIELRGTGTTYAVTVNGSQLATATDAQPSTTASLLGVQVSQGDTTLFDNLLVTT